MDERVMNEWVCADATWTEYSDTRRVFSSRWSIQSGRRTFQSLITIKIHIRRNKELQTTKKLPLIEENSTGKCEQ